METKEKIEQGKEISAGMGQVEVFNFMVRVGLLEKVSFEQVCMQRRRQGSWPLEHPDRTTRAKTLGWAGIYLTLLFGKQQKDQCVWGGMARGRV